MALIAEEEFDREVTRRVISDTRMGAFSGLPHGADVLNSEMPVYSAYGGSLLDIVDGTNLEGGLWIMDQFKNSKMYIYNGVGGLVVVNPRAMVFHGATLSASPYGGGQALIINISGNVVWGTRTSLNGNFSHQELPADHWTSGMWMNRGFISIIGMAIPIITGYGMYGRRAVLAN